MTTSTPCAIKLLNKTYEVKCPEAEVSNLHLAAEKLNEQLLLNKKKFKHLDELQNFVLAALHISHELVACKQQEEQRLQQMTQFIYTLENKIYQVVNGNNTLVDPQTD